LTARRFNDLIGLGFEGYPALLALAVLAWHEGRGSGGHVVGILKDVLVGSDWFREKLAYDAVYVLDVRGYLEFKCQNPVWKHGNWRRCPRDWRLAEAGYRRLQELLGNLGLTLSDIQRQPSPRDVKALIDGRIRQLYREHWARVKRYEEVAGLGFR
jgi:hypothetical protein